MIRSSELTNGELRSYKEEYDRLFMERKRLDLHIDAILTTAAIKLEKIYNTTRLDYAHLSNAYLAYTQNGLDRKKETVFKKNNFHIYIILSY